MHRSRRCLPSLAALGASAALVLAGCSNPDAQPGGETPPTATESPDSDPTGTPSEDPTEAPTPEPSSDPEEPDPLPSIESLIITPKALGPLQVNVPLEVNPGAAMLTWDEDACVFDGEPIDVGDPGRWVSAYPEDTTPPPGFFVDVVDGIPLRIDLVGSQIPTDRGIAIGSPIEDLHAAYPELVAGTSTELSSVWWVMEPGGTLVFETQDDSMGGLPAGVNEGVILIRVLAPGFPPDWQAANSGNIAGACF